MADAVVVAELVHKDARTVVPLQPEISAASKTGVGHSAGADADGGEGDAHNVIVAKSRITTTSGGADRANVDRGVRSGFIRAKGVACVAQEFRVQATTRIVSGGLWHGVEVGAHGGLDPGFTIGVGADLIADRAIQDSGCGCLGDRFGGVVGKVDTDQKDFLLGFRPCARLHVGEGFERIPVDRGIARR